MKIFERILPFVTFVVMGCSPGSEMEGQPDHEQPEGAKADNFLPIALIKVINCEPGTTNPCPVLKGSLSCTWPL